MRGREFVMKDAYSFDVSDEAAGESYEKMYAAYHKVFQRCGLDFRAVEADTGTIGGSFSHEFMVLAQTGEDTLVICEQCSYAANVEKARVAPRDEESPSVALQLLRKVETPGMKKVEAVADFLQTGPADFIKTMVFFADGEPVAVLVRGDREVQPVKLKNLLGATEVELAADEEVFQKTKLPVGYLGPVGLPIKVVADQEVMRMRNCISGANEKQYHLTGVQPGRDFTPAMTGDLRQITAEDSCPSCGGPLKLTEGIEVGHIFKLGTAYSEAMNATFQDSEGQGKHFVMGCYGIGVSRVVAAAIEQNHDRHGIIFPLPLAPFQVILLNLGMNSEKSTRASEQLYQDLKARGVEVLYDDRDERPGSKFKDADLIGIPFRVTVGKTFENDGEIEVRTRRDGQTETVGFAAAAEVIAGMIKTELGKYAA
jgi:prolyl-tRNA synthetase